MTTRLVKSLLSAVTLAVLLVVFHAPVATQVTPLPHDSGPVGLGLLLRQLPNDGDRKSVV